MYIFRAILYSEGNMRRVSCMLLVPLLALWIGCNGKQETVQPEPVSDGLFLHISSGPDQPHRFLMPLQMAVTMSKSNDVLIFFDIDAVKGVVKDAPDISYENFSGSREQIRKLVSEGVTLMVCPGCLKAAGYTPEDLMDGVRVADRETFFNFTKGRILSLDY